MTPTPPQNDMVTQVTHRAMATEFVVLLPPQHAGAVEAAVAAMDELDEIEKRLTVYDAASEISRVNLVADEQPVRVSRSTFELIERAVLWSQRTDGAFDITAGPLVEVWGFLSRSGRKPTSEEIEAARQRVGSHKLSLDAGASTIAFTTPGMSLNMGGIGKGDAIDRVARRLHDAGVTDFLFHGGASSVIAAGDQVAGSGKGWAVGIGHPTKPNRRLGGIWLRDAALATSGSGKQFFHYRGKRYGHVIDPRTGYPAGDLLSLTVIMSSAGDADACSTGMFVAGEDSNFEDADWERPATIAVAEGQRQDETQVESSEQIDWVDESSDEFAAVSRMGTTKRDPS